jgi:hypothetical protein
MKKEDVLKVIDEVMNNREIDSIRNAILAIRDKVIELEDDSDHYAVLKLRGNNEPYVTIPFEKGDTHIIIDTWAKCDTGEYGEIMYQRLK